MGINDCRITVSFPEGTKKKIEQLAYERDWNLSQVVREIIKEYFAEGDLPERRFKERYEK